MNIKEIYETACEKARRNAYEIGRDIKEFIAQPDGMYFKPDRSRFLEIGNIGCWMASFFTGMAAYSFLENKDEKLLQWLYSLYPDYRKKVFDNPLESMHDLGFLYMTYSTAVYRITGDEKMKELSVRAADVLAHRFMPNGGYIRAWGRMDDDKADNKGLEIIDCMMNLSLLYFASEETGDPFYKNVAVQHADTTLKYLIRDDYSVCHAYMFDYETGKPLMEKNYCGFGVGSHWARGTAWAIYGFANSYKHTKKERYLEAAVNIAKKYIKQCGEKAVPIWDFRLPEETPALPCYVPKDFHEWDFSLKENTKYNVDTSAAAIASLGMLEILSYKNIPEFRKYIDKAVDELCSIYFNPDLNVNGLVKYQNGNGGYTPFGDYYFMELLHNVLYTPVFTW